MRVGKVGSMLRSIKDLIGYPVEAVDGMIGKVSDCLFDDTEWGLRYLVVDAGGWMTREKVLVSPRDLVEPEVGWVRRHFPVNLSKEQIHNCPPLDADAPVSRQYEQEFAQYFQHSSYWEGAFIWGATLSPHAALPPSPEQDEAHEARMAKIAQSHLRSCREALGYNVAVKDGHMGELDDFILDTQPWRLRHVVVHTSWLPGHRVLIDIDWITEFDWSQRTALAELTREEVKNSPKYNHHDPVNRDYEKRLYDYYGKPCYWEK